MALKPISEAEILAQQAELKEKLMPAADISMANSEAIERLVQVSKFEFPQGSGTWYEVPRVPYYEGMRLNDIYMTIRSANKNNPDFASVGVYDVLLREVLVTAWKLCRPLNRRKRWLKCVKLAFNPFTRMTEIELAELLGFFLVRRMASSVSFHYPTNR